MYTIFEEEKKDHLFANLTVRAANSKSKRMIEIFKDVIAGIHKLPILDQQDFREKVLYLWKKIVDKHGLNVDVLERKIFKGVLITKYFVKKKSDMICMNAVKGNIALCIQKTEYVGGTERLLSDEDIFEILNKNPVLKPKSIGL